MKENYMEKEKNLYFNIAAVDFLLWFFAMTIFFYYGGYFKESIHKPDAITNLGFDIGLNISGIRLIIASVSGVVFSAAVIFLKKKKAGKPPLGFIFVLAVAVIVMRSDVLARFFPLAALQSLHIISAVCGLVFSSLIPGFAAGGLLRPVSFPIRAIGIDNPSDAPVARLGAFALAFFAVQIIGGFLIERYGFLDMFRFVTLAAFLIWLCYAEMQKTFF